VTNPPPTDPTELYRIRDCVYAADLLIVAIAELDLFTWLARHGPASTAELCAALDLNPRPADVLRTYLLARGLLVAGPDGRVTPSALAADHLAAGSRYDLRAYYASLRERPACGELLTVLRTGVPAAWASAVSGRDWADRLDSPDFAASITAAMDARGAYLGPALAEAIADLPARRVLDIGGGSGCYGCALLDRRPDLQVDVLERPPVDQAARTLLAHRGHGDRVGVYTGDMFDGLPTGYDLHLFSHVLHDWDEDRVRALIVASYAALPRGGWLVDHDTHLDADKTGPLPVAEYSVLLMHSTPGRCWSVDELAQMTSAVGFGSIEVRPTAADRTVLITRKP
jgi:hypothetical protein